MTIIRRVTMATRRTGLRRSRPTANRPRISRDVGTGTSTPPGRSAFSMGASLVCPTKSYEVDFIDHADRAFARSSFEAEDHASAIQLANARFRVNVGKGHVIWHAGECIHIEIYEPAKD